MADSRLWQFLIWVGNDQRQDQTYVNFAQVDGSTIQHEVDSDLGLGSTDPWPLGFRVVQRSQQPIAKLWFLESRHGYCRGKSEVKDSLITLPNTRKPQHGSYDRL
uniref:Uncharacterized protein n=1 Tax=Eutreptiella gymnastica TaxID=73025 RepID=A0A7S4FQ16_9EUGL